MVSTTGVTLTTPKVQGHLLLLQVLRFHLRHGFVWTRGWLTGMDCPLGTLDVDLIFEPQPEKP